MREVFGLLKEQQYFRAISHKSNNHYMYEFIRYNNYYHRHSLVDVIYDYISHCHIIGVKSSMIRDCAFEKYYMSYWKPSKYNDYTRKRSLRDLV